MNTGLAGKVALVNGASRGIGESIARALAQSGAKVVCTSRKLDGVQAVADAINEAGGEAVARSCHAGELDQIETLLAWIRDEFGRLDVLVNNAAANPYYGPAAGLPSEAFDKTVAVNLKGPFYFMSHAVPLMADSGGGAIVNVASIAAIHSMPGQAVYSMTKAGLVSLTKSFAREYGQSGIRVNAILPGVVETKFAEALTNDPGVQQMAGPFARTAGGAT